ncbi:hypothetical protein AAHZ94_15075 [Streptomyces sp. HSW2009]|uniref:hypothetical protein n=1 Tax=Streptomyces sp. HSW2009 TaxID=3142890 RepID=UPI0032ED28F9
MPPTTRSHVLTGQHAVQLAEGTVLRFFLARGDEVGGPGEWGAVTDAEFQYAYEIALFDPAGIAVGELRPNARRVHVPLDSVVGVGGFLWADGAADAGGSGGSAGVMTTNGKTPQDCGLLLAEFLVETGGAA